MHKDFSIKILILLVFFLIPFHLLSQWTSLPSLPLTGTNNSISVASPNVVWAAGGATSPMVMRSINGGTGFVNVTGDMTGTPELYCIWAVDQNTAYAGDGGAVGGAGGNAKVWKTTNGGLNWNVILTTGGTAGFIDAICFSRTNPLIGFIESDPPAGVGTNYWLAKTTNGGVNWTITTPPGAPNEAGSLNGLAVIDDQMYGFGMGNTAPARIRWTSNGGTTWSLAILSGLTGGYISGFAIKSDKTIMLAATGDAGSSSLPVIGRSSDGGNNWTNVNTGSGLTGYCTIKWVYGTNVCYITGGTGTNGNVRRSTDGGVSWSTQTTDGVQNLVHMELVYSGGLVYGYAISSGGLLIKLVESPVGIDPDNQTIPVEYKLNQNYPNPFNPSTTIKYSLPKASQVTLKIYDALGNEVRSIVDKYEQAGNYVERFDGSELASGVYFYKLNAGDYTETKKMSLVK